jgi:hypothetical protein
MSQKSMSSRFLHPEMSRPLAELSNALDQATDESGVWCATAMFASMAMGGEPLVLRRAAGAPANTIRFEPVYLSAGVAAIHVFDAPVSLEGMGLVHLPPPGMSSGAFHAVFESIPCASGGLVYVQINDVDVLLLAYRAPPPVLSRAKWRVLQQLAQLTAGALVRVHSPPGLVSHSPDPEKPH